MLRTRRAAARRALASTLAGALVAMAAVVGVATPAVAAGSTLVASSTAVPGEAVTVAVTGAGFENAPVFPGQPFRSVYVGFVEAGSFDADQSTTPALSLRVSDSGTVSGELTVPAATLDRSRSYEVIAWPTRSFPSAANVLARTSVAIDWDALFPRVAEQTVTSLTVSPAGESVDAQPLTLSAAVSPAADGTVTFTDGQTALGTTAVAGGIASLTTSTLAVGDHQLSASFTPADPSAYIASTSAAVNHTVAPRPATPEPPRIPTLTLSKSAGLDPAGEEIAVTGTGYDPSKPIYLTTCTDRPLTDVDFAFIAAGCTAGAKVVTSSPTTPTMVTFAPDGSFETTLTVAPKGDTTAVYTIADRRAMADRSQDAKASVSFAAAPVDPAPAPTLTVTPDTDVDPSGATLTVEGQNYEKTAGFALRFGWANDTWKPSAGGADIDRRSVVSTRVSSAPAADANVQWRENADGTVDFSWTVEVSKTVADQARPSADHRLGVFTFGNAATDGIQPANELFVPVTWSAVVPQPEPQPTTEPRITVTPNADLDPAVENTLVVSGTGYRGDSAVNGVYVGFGETSVWAGTGPLPSDGWITLSWVRPEAIVDGAFTTELTIPAGATGPSANYHVVTSAAHELSIIDRSLDAFAEVTVAQPSRPFVAFPGGASAAQGGTIDIAGGGFAAGDIVTAIARSEPVTIGTATADAAGRVSWSWMVPTGFAAGAHTLELSVGGTVVASAGFTVTAAVVTPAIETVPMPSCVARSVSGATIQWGVKESYRSYITGPIARGEISGGWGSGSGAYSPENDRGRVSFGGAVHYTGHGGLLDMTLSNPRVQVTGANTASLIVNVQSKGYNGSSDVNANGVVFAALSLPAATETANRVSWDGAAATLTAAGAEAFGGFYAAGEALDPVSFAFPLGAEVPCDASTDATLAATGGDAPLDLMWVGAGMLLIGALAVSIARRRLMA
ncbi:HtaA domain-containing protein [Microbacterium thalli]|uniref:HtaA domain-containing protein n=1 Tax=Microbacterium thalli TaxID=3027921 RepID=UPI002365C796|nr:HtaA domain-containing protein [Microbacterium thalli]MDD7928442.1 HtaA domain-containing protein [Microbacterium thalli]